MLGLRLSQLWNSTHRVLLRRAFSTTAERASTAAKEQNNSKMRLYNYRICPFCNKVKTFLDYAGIDYEAIEVNPLTKSEIQWSKDYRKVPILTMNDNVVLTGSDDIVKALLQFDSVTSNLVDKRWKKDEKKTMMSLDAFQSNDAQHWINFSNDDLSPLLYPNICRTLRDSYDAFSYVNNVDSFTNFERVSIRLAGSLAMYMAASRVKKKRNISDERQALEDALVTLEQDGLQDKSFLSGREEPHLGDLAVFGALRSIEGLTTHKEVIAHRGGPLQEWYERTKSKVNARL